MHTTQNIPVAREMSSVRYVELSPPAVTAITHTSSRHKSPVLLLLRGVNVQTIAVCSASPPTEQIRRLLYSKQFDHQNFECMFRSLHESVTRSATIGEVSSLPTILPPTDTNLNRWTLPVT